MPWISKISLQGNDMAAISKNYFYQTTKTHIKPKVRNLNTRRQPPGSLPRVPKVQVLLPILTNVNCCISITYQQQLQSCATFDILCRDVIIPSRDILNNLSRFSLKWSLQTNTGFKRADLTRFISIIVGQEITITFVCVGWSLLICTLFSYLCYCSIFSLSSSLTHTHTLTHTHSHTVSPLSPLHTRLSLSLPLAVSLRLMFWT